MEESVKERIKKILLEKKISLTQLSKQCGVNQKTLNNQINSVTQLSASNILLILSNFEDISAEWLLRGRGEMYLSSEEQENKTLSNKSQEELQLLREKIIRLEAENKVLREVAGLSNAEAIKGKSA